MKNEKEVANFLENEGFQIVKLENLNFKDQVKIFQNAKIIAGLHGAGFANVCFCRPDTKIVEIKSNRTAKLYENLAITNSLDYRSLMFESENFVSENYFGEIEVSISMLKKTIEN